MANKHSCLLVAPELELWWLLPIQFNQALHKQLRTGSGEGPCSPVYQSPLEQSTVQGQYLTWKVAECLMSKSDDGRALFLESKSRRS